MKGVAPLELFCIKDVIVLPNFLTNDSVNSLQLFIEGG
jgi:hypothetical protein